MPLSGIHTITGKVDILIGTHRLLSKDVIFKDLGLLIIDEEQKFGVVHKEKINWGKLDISTPKFIIESDAIIVAPLIFAYLLDL